MIKVQKKSFYIFILIILLLYYFLQVHFIEIKIKTTSNETIFCDSNIKLKMITHIE